MKYLKALVIAFSLYSRIPMPRFEWKDEELKYQFIFFPLIGAVTGGLLILWNYLADLLNVGDTAYTLAGCAIPLLVTGGFHVDGFMDTADALRSYKDRQEKLKIMKDPHTGAFAVISLLTAGLIYAAAFSQIRNVMAFAGTFVLSRILSASGALFIPKARDDGMLNMIAGPAGKVRKKVSVILMIEGVLILAYMIIMDPISGSLMGACAVLVLIWYRHRMIRELGGVTGDTAGYFVTVCEVAMAAVCALCSLITAVI